MYIEPCCIDKILPELLRSNLTKGKNGLVKGSVFFQSAGDWTVIDLIKSTLPMTGKAVLVICVPEVETEFLNYLRVCLSRDWCEEVMIITSCAQENLIRNRLGEYIDKVTYSVNKGVCDGFLGLAGEDKYLSVYGPMLMEKDFNIALFAASYGTDSDIFFSASAAFLPLFRMHSVIHSKGNKTATLLNHKIF